jgi:hypothetical protein
MKLMLVVYSGSQQIPRLVWNLHVHYHVQKSPSPAFILIQVYPIETLQTHLSKIRFNIIPMYASIFQVTCSTHVRYQVLTAASMNRVFWDLAPCSYVEVNRRFSGAY